MNKFFVSLTAGAALLLLSGCVTEEQANAKVGKGCEAAVKTLIDPKEIMEIKSIKYGSELEADGLYRSITLNVHERDGWSEQDSEYSCLFEEQWGPLKSSHTALFIQATIDGETVGKEHGVIKGDLDDFLKLTEVVNKAMDQ